MSENQVQVTIGPDGNIYIQLPENWEQLLAQNARGPMADLTDLRMGAHIYGKKMVTVIGSAICPPEMEGVPGAEEMFYFLTKVLKMDLPTPKATGIRKYSLTSKEIHSGKNAGKHYWRINFRYIPEGDESESM